MTENQLACILVVEFDTIQRDLIVLALNRSPFKPIVCDDLSQLRLLIKEFQPKVLLIDLYLPLVNGLDLIKNLGQEGFLEQKSVIAISAMGFPEIVSQALKMGVDDFLIKPINSDFLLSRIQRAVQKSQLP